jgi:hypothetical protein
MIRPAAVAVGVVLLAVAVPIVGAVGWFCAFRRRARAVYA